MHSPSKARMSEQEKNKNFAVNAWAWYGMEEKFRYGIWKMPEWNEMEDFKNVMENNFPYFHTNQFRTVLKFVHAIYRKIYTDSNK